MLTVVPEKYKLSDTKDTISKYRIIDNRTVYFYNGLNPGSKNKKLDWSKDNKLIYIELNDSGNILIQFECVVGLFKEIYDSGEVGDSIPDKDNYYLKLFGDSTIPTKYIVFGIEKLIPNGRYCEYYSNGKLKVEGHYFSGYYKNKYIYMGKVKKWKYYDENGKLIKSEKYKIE
ncbi:MAG: hypothetical protein V4613_07095 [Bacteroidota bacterium]